MNDIVIKIGELLVRAGIVTGVDLSEAEKLAKHMNLQFGQVLIMSGCLSEHDLDCALVAQQLIREELLTVDIACQALGVASQHQMPFEDALEALSVVPKYGAASVEMAELLADAGIIPGELLEQALMTSLTANVSLGELLVRENAISSSLIPVLNMMLADISSGALQEDYAINEIRKNHISWQRSQDSLNNEPMTQTPVMRQSEPPAAPVFVSQELMHAYEIYEPQQQHVQQQNSHAPQQNSPPQLQDPPGQPYPDPTHQPQAEPHQTGQPAPPSYADATPAASATHSIHDVLSMFQQRNPIPEGATPAVPREQQAASWTAFVQSQSFDPNDVEESSVPPMAAAEEPRLRSLEEPSRPLEVVQGTYAKTFDGKSTDLPETFEPIVPPDFEPAAEVIADGTPIKTDTGPQSDADEDEQDESENDEQFSLLVELLIESTYFDREDIIEAITNALKEEAKAVKLIEMLGLADARAIMAASICADALRKNELTSGEAVTVLGDIKGGAEIHEALESVNLELAVTVSANLQMMYDDEVDETFYVGDVSRTVDIFEVDDFVEEQGAATKHQSAAELTPPPVVEVKDELPPIAFGYGRERLKIAKRVEPPVEEKPTPPPVVEPVQAPVPLSPKASDRPSTTIGGKKVSSLSEVFEKLSGVESNGAVAPPAVKPVTATPTPVVPKPIPFTPKPSSSPLSPPVQKGASPATAGPTVRPGTPPAGKPIAANSPSPAESIPAATTSPVWNTMPTSTIPPVADSIPAPTISRVVDSTPAPKISPVVDPTPSTVTPVIDNAGSSKPSSEPSSSTEDAMSDDDKKAARKRNSTTFNSLQAAFVPAAEALVTEPTKEEFVGVSNEASDEYAAYVSKKPSDDNPSEDATPKSDAQQTVDEHPLVSNSDIVSEVSDQVSDQASDKISDQVSDTSSDKVLDKSSDKVSDKSSDKVLDKTTDKNSDKVSNKASDKISNKVSDKISDKQPESTSIDDDDDDDAEEAHDSVSVSAAKKKARSPKAKVRGGAKEKAATAAPSPKKAKRRK